MSLLVLQAPRNFIAIKYDSAANAQGAILCCNFCTPSCWSIK
jgi:hypothetical protein